MRKLFAIIVAIVTIPVLATAGPKMQIPEPAWNFGNVPRTGAFSHPYWIRNIGDDTLRISVRPG
jgi:hypothetical protein